MKYRQLGKTNLKVSVVGIGTHQFCGEWGDVFSQKQVDRILGKANDLGINFIDTAECYGDHISESLIGNSCYSNRDKWIISTKFGDLYDDLLKIRTTDYSLKSVSMQLDKSLKALQTDYIDVYQFHSGTNEEFDIEETWTYLKKQQDLGKIRYLGISVVNSSVLLNDLHQINSIEKVKADVVQVVYNRLFQKANENIIPICREKRIGVIARVPLAKGYLSGKYNPEFVFGNNDNRSSYDKQFTREQLTMVETIQREEVPEKIDMSQWALAWCLKNLAVSTVIPGCKNEYQVEQNAKASELIKE